MTDLFYNPRPAVNFLTLRTNTQKFAPGHVPREYGRGGGWGLANKLPLGEGFAPEIPAGVMESMIGDRLTGKAMATQPINRGQGVLQAVTFS